MRLEFRPACIAVEQILVEIKKTNTKAYNHTSQQKKKKNMLTVTCEMVCGFPGIILAYQS
jgi:hypothetical protein